MIKIYTLGEFDITIDDKSILDEIGSQNRLILLLKYLLAHEGKRLLPERIVENLMEDKDLKEPQNVLRTQISRLRKSFEEYNFYSIDFLNGYYTLNFTRNCRVDYVEFEEQISYGNDIMNESPGKAISVLKEALALYKGAFLPEIEYAEWIIPIRNRLDRIYLKGLSNLLMILKAEGLYHEIIEVCENAIEIKPYEELINKYLIEALTEVGLKRYALSHYEYYTSKLYNDLKIVPSSGIKEVYKTLLNHDDKSKNVLDLSRIDKELELNRYNKGALICEIDYFKFLYDWELRNKARRKQGNIFLGIISLDNIGFTPLKSEEIKKGMSALMVIVYKNLRKNDILSQWNDSQLVTLLYDISEENLYLINNRLQENFSESNINKNINLNIKFKPI